ncbi:MAG: fucose isomerase [Muribaculaceae bacterium]|nr:fucose isomerase [Muribaculaceae bacterium]
MMKLNLITFASSLASRESIFTDHHELLDAIAGKYDVQYIFPEELDRLPNEGATMVLVGSGGVEEMVKACIDRLPRYVVLIADGLKNSLAASLEILSWMRLDGRQGRVLHGPISFIMQGIDDYAQAHEAIDKLYGKCVGVIGKPSGWLIASNVDYEAMSKRWGVTMVDIPLDEVVKGYEAIPDVDVQDMTDEFMRKAIGIKEPSRDEVVKAMRLYSAIKNIVKLYHLDAFTLNCFDLIPTTRTTGCVALALLNQEGIPAGCEGDEQTLLTMLAVQAATGQMTFMANPSKILDNAAHEMVFAHCTIAPAMTDRYIVRDHYESLSGVAVEGIIDPMDMTVVKCGGKEMEHYFISKARLLECTTNPNMCRTQLHLRLEQPLDYFLERSIGNHHVIVRGDRTAPIEAALRLLASTPI